MRSGGQCLFLPRARFKTKGRKRVAGYFLIGMAVACVLKERSKPSFFLAGPERLFVRSGGQCLFLSHAMFEQREGGSGRFLFDWYGGYVVSFIAEICTLVNQSGFIYRQKGAYHLKLVPSHKN
ncbi:TPA: hypothetical protein ROX88_003465 [Bacillus pseudomycoides]|nr:hypothetical protein [Bacillus pseudomycoides]